MSTPSTDPLPAYRDLLRFARRVTASDTDARDLVQDALLVALERGVRDWTSPAHRAWLCGILKKRSAFIGRTTERRKRRERMSTTDVSEQKGWAWQASFLSTLPP